MTAQMQRVAILVLVIGLAVVAPSILIEPGNRASIIAGFSIALLLASTWVWWGLGSVFWRTRRAGPLLLDLGRAHQERATQGILALLSAGLGLWALLTPYLHPRLLALGYLSLAAYGLLQALLPVVRPVQLRSGGISLPAEYIPWARIGAYRLQERGEHGELVLRYRAWAMTPGYPLELTLWLRPEQRKALQAILAEYVVRGARG
jgi:hypothetical protein